MEASAVAHGKRRSSVLRVASLGLTAAVVVFWIMFLRPVSLGGPADYVIVSGHSMEPTFHTGDVVFAFEQHSYRRGEIVVYRVPAGEPAAGDRVIHRIVGGSADKGFVMKGDNKTGVDPWRPKAGDVVGEARSGEELLALVERRHTIRCCHLIVLAGATSGRTRE